MAGRDSTKPLVAVSVFLFGKPAWEIDKLEGSEVTPELLDEIASCGKELERRLSRAAEVGRKLLNGGWEGLGLVYEVDFYKAVSLEDSERELNALGIEPGEVSIREEVEDSEGGERAG